MFSFLLYFIRPSMEKGHASLTNKDGKMQIWVRLFQVYFREKIKDRDWAWPIGAWVGLKPGLGFQLFFKKF